MLHARTCLETRNDQSLRVMRLLKARLNIEIRNYERAIPMNYRQPDEVWPTSTGDDNALMISPVP